MGSWWSPTRPSLTKLFGIASVGSFCPSLGEYVLILIIHLAIAGNIREYIFLLFGFTHSKGLVLLFLSHIMFWMFCLLFGFSSKKTVVYFVHRFLGAKS